MDKNKPAVILMVAEPASKSIATVGDSVALVALVVVVVVEVEVTLASTGVVMLVVTTAVVVVGVVVLAAVVAVGEVVAFSSETWKLALTVRSLSGCTGRKFPKTGDVSFFFRLRRRFIWQKLIRNE